MEPQKDAKGPGKPPTRAAGETLGARTTGGTSPLSVSVTIPASVGRFVVQRRLGRGAFGTVYLATDPTLSRDVAIKVPHDGLTLALRDRFLREARATAAIHHPNVCPVYEAGTDGDLPYLVMHYVAGGTLATYLDEHGALLPSLAMAVTQKLAEGVAAAHEKGVSHRDLKPQNVLFDPVKLHPVVTDFGLAMLSSESRMTTEGAVCGTPAYMSPEQALGRVDKVGPRSDVYSLGVILFHLLTGEVPFRGLPFAVLAQHANAPPVPPSRVRPDLPRQLDAIVLKAMAKKPSDRYPSAREFADSLTESLRGAGLVGAALNGVAIDSPNSARKQTPSPEPDFFPDSAFEVAVSQPKQAFDSHSVSRPAPVLESGDEVPDYDIVPCPDLDCPARVRVARGWSGAIDCPRCAVRFTANTGRRKIAQTAGPIASVPNASRATRPSRDEPPLKRDEWLPVAWRLNASATGQLLSIGSLAVIVLLAAVGRLKWEHPTAYIYLVLIIGTLGGIGSFAWGRFLSVASPEDAPVHPAEGYCGWGEAGAAICAWIVAVFFVLCDARLSDYVYLVAVVGGIGLVLLVAGEFVFNYYLVATARLLGHERLATSARSFRTFLFIAGGSLIGGFIAVVIAIVCVRGDAKALAILSSLVAVICFIPVVSLCPFLVVGSVWLNLKASGVVGRFVSGEKIPTK